MRLSTSGIVKSITLFLLWGIVSPVHSATLQELTDSKALEVGLAESCKIAQHMNDILETSSILSSEDLRASLAELSLQVEYLNDQLPDSQKWSANDMNIFKSLIENWRRLRCSTNAAFQVLLEAENMRVKALMAYSSNGTKSFLESAGKLRILDLRFERHLLILTTTMDIGVAQSNYPGGADAFFKAMANEKMQKRNPSSGGDKS